MPQDPRFPSGYPVVPPPKPPLNEQARRFKRWDPRWKPDSHELEHTHPKLDPPNPELQGIPNFPIDDPSGRLSGKFDGNLMKDVARSAEVRGIDPLTALAMLGQESTFGKYAMENPLRVRIDIHDDPLDAVFGDQSAAGFNRMQNGLDIFKQKSARYPDDPELGIQAYNGMGNVHTGEDIGPAYGGQTNLNGRRDRPYGKRIAEIRDMLSTQPPIKALLGLVRNNNNNE